MVIQNLQFHKEKNLKKVKGSSIAFKIPEDWRISKLKEVAKVDSGNTAPQKEEHFIEGKYPFIRMQHLNVLKENKFVKHFDLINEKAVREKKLKLFKKGSILLPKSGESIRTEKKAMLEFDSYVVNHLAVVEVEDIEKLDNEYLFYYFRHFKLSSLIMQTTTPSINLSTIREIEIPLPPLHEQRKIAHVLTTIDKAIEEVDKAIKKAERIKNGLMQELLTKGIGHKEFKNTEIGKIPKDWKIVKVKHIFNVETGTTPSTKKLIYWINGTVNWITPADLSKLQGKIHISDSERKITKQALQDCNLSLLPENSIIISTRAPVGYVAIVDKKSTFNQGCKGLVPKTPEMESKFYAYYFLSIRKKLEQLSGGSTFKELPKKALEELLIPLPSFEEQKKIAEILSEWDRVIELKKTKKEKLERMKKKVMELLLTGKVRVK